MCCRRGRRKTFECGIIYGFVISKYEIKKLGPCREDFFFVAAAFFVGDLLMLLMHGVAN